MEKLNGFEDLIVWNKSKKLAVLVYQSFKMSQDYGFNGQIQRASVSVMNNMKALKEILQNSLNTFYR